MDPRLGERTKKTAALREPFEGGWFRVVCFLSSRIKVSATPGAQVLFEPLGAGAGTGALPALYGIVFAAPGDDVGAGTLRSYGKLVPSWLSMRTVMLQPASL